MSALIENVTCKFCGCLCDDITIEVEGDRILKAKKACPNGRGMFLNYDPASRKPLVDGQIVGWDEAVAATVDILNEADSPLIYGLSSTSTEAQRKAVELADRLGRDHRFDLLCMPFPHKSGSSNGGPRPPAH